MVKDYNDTIYYIINCSGVDVMLNSVTLWEWNDSIWEPGWDLISCQLHPSKQVCLVKMWKWSFPHHNHVVLVPKSNQTRCVVTTWSRKLNLNKLKVATWRRISVYIVNIYSGDWVAFSARTHPASLTAHKQCPPKWKNYFVPPNKTCIFLSFQKLVTYKNLVS